MLGQALIDGFAASWRQAVAAATAAGAPRRTLQAITDLGTALKTSSDALAASVAANLSSVGSSLSGWARASSGDRGRMWHVRANNGLLVMKRTRPQTFIVSAAPDRAVRVVW